MARRGNSGGGTSGLDVVLGLGVGLGIAYLFLKSSTASGSPREDRDSSPRTGPANALGYTTASWVPLLAGPCKAAGIPPAYARQAIKEESDGNPCSIGRPGDVAPDGNPRELGIYQVYNPDDLKKLGVTSQQLRAYCVAGMFPVTYRGKMVMSHSQSVARPLTPQEMQQQVDVTVGKIIESRDYANRYATAAGVTWPRSPDAAGVDFWRLVKLVHGLPGLVQGLVPVAKKLGHPPSWQEFRSTIENGAVVLDPKTESHRHEFGSIFNNAEHATSGMS